MVHSTSQQHHSRDQALTRGTLENINIPTTVLSYLRVWLRWNYVSSLGHIAFLPSGSFDAFPKGHCAKNRAWLSAGRSGPIASPLACLFLSLPHSDLWPGSGFRQRIWELGLWWRPMCTLSHPGSFYNCLEQLCLKDFANITSSSRQMSW